jgi:hypothetical protein
MKRFIWTISVPFGLSFDRLRMGIEAQCVCSRKEEEKCRAFIRHLSSKCKPFWGSFK